jgi:hypothetical protein
MKMLPDHAQRNKILLLHRALYELRISPILWQQQFIIILTKIGYTQVPYKPCCFINQGIILFFYVDNIIITFRNKNHTKVNKLIKSLKKHYNISGGNPAQWFLGMEILRNLPLGHIWLSQKAYIEKIANLANHRKIYLTPISSNELLPNQKHASPAKIQNYQRKIGLLLFAAISIRPNIAFAILRLAKFLNNPSLAHHKAADRALIYLYNTRQLFLYFGG